MLISVWVEGYAVTGNSAGAYLKDRVEAKTLQDACDKIASRDPEWKKYYNRDRMTWWGCRIFDNEADARKFFG